MLCRIRYLGLKRLGQRRGCGSNIDWCKFTRRQAPWFFSVQYDTRPYSNDTRLYSSGIVPLASNFIHQIIRYGKGGGSQSIWSWYPAQRCAIQARLCPAGQMMGKRYLEAGKSRHPYNIANPGFDLRSVMAGQ